MGVIKLETGLQEVDINGKRTVMINPTDEGYLQDLYGLLSKLEEIAKHTEPGEHTNLAERFEASRERDKMMREAVDGMFGEGFCQDVFGSTRLFALSGGLTLIEQLLYGVIDYMDEDIRKQQAARSEKIRYYTEKYRKRGRK